MKISLPKFQFSRELSPSLFSQFFCFLKSFWNPRLPKALDLIEDDYKEQFPGTQKNKVKGFVAETEEHLKTYIFFLLYNTIFGKSPKS